MKSNNDMQQLAINAKLTVAQRKMMEKPVAGPHCSLFFALFSPLHDWLNESPLPQQQLSY